MTEIWLAGALLAVLLAIVRSSLLPQWWQAAVPAVLVAVWVQASYDTVARLPLARVYAPLADRDVLALVLMTFIAESVIAIRAALRFTDEQVRPTTWQQMLALTPMLSLFAGLRLIAAHAFQYVPATVDFGTFGFGLALVVFVALTAAPQLVRIVLPERPWRIELYLLLRTLLIVGIFAGYATVTITPTPPPDASLSLSTMGFVVGGLVAIGLLGAMCDGALMNALRKRAWLNPDIL
jgi:hypothetical protein